MHRSTLLLPTFSLPFASCTNEQVEVEMLLDSLSPRSHVPCSCAECGGGAGQERNVTMMFCLFSSPHLSPVFLDRLRCTRRARHPTPVLLPSSALLLPQSASPRPQAVGSP